MNILRSIVYFLGFWCINSVYLVLFIMRQNQSSDILRTLLGSWAKKQKALLSLIGIKITYLNFVKGNYLYCGQHQSYADALVFLAEYPEVRCIATDEIKKFPLMNKIGSKLGFIFIKSGGKNLNTLLESLDRDSPILIYPEGKLTPVGDPLVIKSGFYHIAKALDFKVVIFSTNLGKFYPQNLFIKRPGNAILNFSSPMPINDLSLGDAKQFLCNQINRLLGSSLYKD